MDTKEKLALLEDIMELDEGTLTPETRLDDLDEWDSLSALSFVVMLGDEFNRKISGQEVRAFERIQDMLAVMAPEA
ncbi:MULTISPECIES: acyl carrier protein [unclassified Desulfovibrio]|uniref:acyl carrier protein n=1 Tax=unclassified Desulfovibrio TaxID=2593640 RepID=UPI0013EBE2D0|nr:MULTISPECIES: acyl carrier protein [unclassified Desulfovibrio]